MILDDITAERRIQLEREKAENPSVIREAEKIAQPARDFEKALKRADNEPVKVIAEVKKASPSKGIISHDFNPAEKAADYENSGGDAVSVLTEEHYFKGSNIYIEQIRNKITLPILRKDFIIDPFQIYHARVLGADAVLLIVALLSKEVLKEYIKIAHSLSLHALIEVHDQWETELAQSCGGRIIGVNNRDLKTFEVNLSTTEKCMAGIGAEKVRISESGIKTRSHVLQAVSYGADGVLVGESLMRGQSIKELKGLE